MYCSQCGTYMPEGCQFCGQCGAPAIILPKKGNGLPGMMPGMTGKISAYQGPHRLIKLSVKPGQKVHVGRNPECHIVYTAPEVSRKHCSIWLDQSTDEYVVTDCSSRGTFSKAKRTKLPKDQAVKVRRGDVLYLAASENQIVLE